MITSVKYNSNLYAELFAKANDRLKTLGIMTDDVGKEGTEEIESIEEYFAHLKDLVYGTGEVPPTSEELQERFIFLKLPLDEPPIWIDANTRTISKKIEEGGYGYWAGGKFQEYKIGSNHPFFTNGIAVQGDETAEIVYFEIDRFFDAMDLNLADIAVQWIHEDDLKSSTNPLYNYTPIVIKDITSQTGKLIFGWPIGKDITEKPGKIHFSVRFYQLQGSGQDSIVYSLSTQTQTVVINPTILANIADEDAYIDNKIDLIVNRLQNSIFVGAGNPDVPEFILLYPDQNIIIDEVDEEGIYLYALARAGKGSLTYSWEYYDENDENTRSLSDFSKIDSYLETNAFNEQVMVYYYIDANGMYQPVSLKSEEDFNAEIRTPLYIKCSRFNLNAENIKAGKYRVDILNQYYGNSLKMSDEEHEEGREEYLNSYWTVAGPDQPIITTDLLDQYVIGDELVVKAENVNANTECRWYISNNDENIVMNGPEGLKYSGTQSEGIYSLKITNTKNKVFKDIPSKSTFVYSPLEELVEDNIDSEAERADDKIKVKVKLIDYELSPYDEISYIWKISEGPLNTLKDFIELQEGEDYFLLNKNYDFIVENFSGASGQAVVNCTINIKKVNPVNNLSIEELSIDKDISVLINEEIE